MVTLFLYLVSTGYLVLASNMSQLSGDMVLFMPSIMRWFDGK